MTEVSRTTDAAAAAAKRAAEAAEAAARAKQATDAAKKSEPDATKKSEADAAKPAAPDAKPAAPDAKRSEAPAAKTPAPSVDATATAETQAKKGEEAQKKLGTAPSQPNTSEPTQPGMKSQRTAEATKDKTPERPDEMKRLSERIRKEPVEGAAELRKRVDESKTEAERRTLIDGTKEAVADRMARMGEIPDAEKRKKFVDDVGAAAEKAGPEAARALGKEIAKRLDDAPDSRAATAAMAQSAYRGEGTLLATTTLNAMKNVGRRGDLTGAVRARLQEETAKLERATDASKKTLTHTARFLDTHGAHLSDTEKAKATAALMERDKDVYQQKLSADADAAKVARAAAEATKNPDLKSTAKDFAEATRTSFEQTKLAQAMGKLVSKGLAELGRSTASTGALGQKIGVGVSVLAAMAAQSPAELMQAGSDVGKGSSDLARARVTNADLAKGLRSAATTFGALTTAAGALAAAVNASKGEWERAGLGFASAAANGVSTWASAANTASQVAKVAGRAANVAGLVTTLGQVGYEIYREHKNELAYQDAAKDALKAAGFDSSRANALSKLSDKSGDTLDRIAKETGRSRRDVINELMRGSERDQQVGMSLINRIPSLPLLSQHDRATNAELRDLYARLRGPQPHPSL